MRLLFLTPQLPYPPRQGTALRNWGLISHLAARHEVWLLSFDEQPASAERKLPEPLRRSCQNIVTLPIPQRALADRLRTLATSQLPDMAWRLWSPVFAQALGDCLREHRFDILQMGAFTRKWGRATICGVKASKMTDGKSCRLNLALVALVATTGLSACGAAPPAQPPPSLRLVEPAQGALLTTNQEVPIRMEYSGPASAQVYVWVNGQRLGMLPAEPGSAAASFVWMPQTIGNHVLYLEARDGDGNLIVRSEVVSVRVELPTLAAQPAAPAPPTPSPATQPTPPPAPAPTVEPTPAPTEVPQATATPAPTATPGLTVANDFVNLRAGPGTNYDLLGRLSRGQMAQVTGKSSDGQWWRVSVQGKTAWVSGQFVQANDAAGAVSVVQAPPPPPPTPTPVPLVAISPTAVPDQAAQQPTVQPTPAEPECNPSNPYWAARLNNAPDYTFCTPVPFEFVPNASPDPDEMVIRWHIYGIQSLELRIDPSGDECGMGTRGLRQQVPFKTDNFRLNRRDWPPGGYKIGLFATLHDGRIQDWGELHFCGK